MSHQKNAVEGGGRLLARAVGVCNLVFLSRYMRPEGPWQRLRRCPRAVGSSYFTYNLFPGTRPALPVIVGPPTPVLWVELLSEVFSTSLPFSFFFSVAALKDE